MTIKRTLAITAATIAAFLAVGWIGAPSVQAHNALATPSCTALVWSATNYDKTQTNSIAVLVDGATVHQDLDFKASDVGSVAWSQTANHTWSVVVNAPGTQYDRSFAGTWQACQVAPTTTVPGTTTTVPATTTTQPGQPPADTTPPVDQVTTTTVVAVDIPPVPCPYNPAVPAGDPACVATVVTVVVSDVAVLTPAEPVLPRTGLDQGDIVGIAICLVLMGGFLILVVKGRRVP